MEQDRREHLSARITGEVQGVFFRAFTRDRAHELGLSGWVRNEPDGSVRIEAEGPKERLDRLLEAVRKGPPRARVDGVEAERRDAEDDYAGFQIRHH